MGCGCGGQKRIIQKPELQRPTQMAAPAPRYVQKPTIPENAVADNVPANTNNQPAVQAANESQPNVVQAIQQPTPTPAHVPIRPVPQIPTISSNADAIREALRKRREATIALKAYSTSKQY